MIHFSQKGDFSRILKYLNGLRSRKYRDIIEKYAKEGVEALRSNTPVDSGVTADSWDYEIVMTKKGFSINWTNSKVVDSVPIVILLQYGHATRSGSFVEGRDFINPAMKPIFDRIVESLWKEVESV
jgi:hypothetical protein